MSHSSVLCKSFFKNEITLKPLVGRLFQAYLYHFLSNERQLVMFNSELSFGFNF